MNTFQILVGKDLKDCTDEEKTILSGLCAGVLKRLADDDSSFIVLKNKFNGFYAEGNHYLLKIIDA